MNAPLLILSGLLLLDCLTTSLVLSRGGVERNPAMRWVMEHAYWPWLGIFTTHAALIAFLWWQRPGLYVLLVMIGFYLKAVSTNIGNLWRLRE